MLEHLSLALARNADIPTGWILDKDGQATTNPADFKAGSDLAVAWIEQNRAALLTGTASIETITSFNVPGCTAGEIRELFEVPLADSIPEGANVFLTDCSVEPEGPPSSDVDAMLKGFAAQTDVPLDL